VLNNGAKCTPAGKTLDVHSTKQAVFKKKPKQQPTEELRNSISRPVRISAK